MREHIQQLTIALRDTLVQEHVRHIGNALGGDHLRRERNRNVAKLHCGERYGHEHLVGTVEILRREVDNDADDREDGKVVVGDEDARDANERVESAEVGDHVEDERRFRSYKALPACFVRNCNRSSGGSGSWECVLFGRNVLREKSSNGRKECVVQNDGNASRAILPSLWTARSFRCENKTNPFVLFLPTTHSLRDVPTWGESSEWRR